MAGSAERVRRVRCGEVLLDVDSGEIWRDGKRRSLRPIATKALQLLVSSRGRLVTREELRRHLWGDAALEWETGLYQVIRQLRRALGDDSAARGFIVTLPGRGYRWNAPIRPRACRPEPEALPPSSTRGIRWAAAWYYLAGAASLPLLFLVYCLLAGLGH